MRETRRNSETRGRTERSRACPHRPVILNGARQGSRSAPAEWGKRSGGSAVVVRVSSGDPHREAGDRWNVPGPAAEAHRETAAKCRSFDFVDRAARVPLRSG